MKKDFNSASGAEILLEAVKQQDTDLVRKLLDMGADPNLDPPAPVAAAKPAAPPQETHETSAKVTDMSTDRAVTAPTMARWKKTKPKRETTL